MNFDLENVTRIKVNVQCIIISDKVYTLQTSSQPEYRVDLEPRHACPALPSYPDIVWRVSIVIVNTVQYLDVF